MKVVVNKLVDSDDDMDNLPLKYISSGQKRHESIKELKSYSVHACEICEKSFVNRYDYLIHNAKHIIIPLIKMLPHHCAKCGIYCISQEEMNDHIKVKHKTVIKPHSIYTNDSKIKSKKNNFQMEDINEDDEPLNYLIKKENEKKIAQANISENILQNFVKNCKVDVEKLVPPLLYQYTKKDIKINTHESNSENCEADNRPFIDTKFFTKNDRVNYVNHVVEFKSYKDENNIVKSDVDHFQNPVVNSNPPSEFTDVDEDPIVILAPVKEKIVPDHHNAHNSIHYDELMKPGIFYCKRCYNRFPNRYEVLVHEIIHLDLSKAAPKYLNVKHKNDTPSTISLTPGTTSKHISTCDCYKYLHAKTCFKLNNNASGQGFHNRKFVMAHVDKCNREAVVNICDTCLYLRDRPKHVQYFGIVRLNKLEVKRSCHWCAKLCKDVSLVTLISRQRLVDRIRFEGDVVQQDVKVHLGALANVKEPVGKQYSKTSERRVQKNLSNLERLKLIQNRLKLMKK